MDFIKSVQNNVKVNTAVPANNNTKPEEEIQLNFKSTNPIIKEEDPAEILNARIETTKKEILAELRKDPHNADIKESDVQKYIMENKDSLF